MMISSLGRRIATRGRTFLRRSARALPKPLARSIVRRHIARRAIAQTQRAMRNVRRLNTGSLAEYGPLPWAKQGVSRLSAGARVVRRSLTRALPRHVSRPVVRRHLNRIQRTTLGSGVQRASRAVQHRASAVSRRVDNIRSQTRSYEDKVGAVKSAIKGGRLIREGIGMTRFKGFLTPRGALMRTVAHRGAQAVRQFGRFEKQFSRVTGNLKKASQYSQLAATGNVAGHVTQKLASNVRTRVTKPSNQFGALKTAGKAGARFVPGANIGMAVYDVRRAWTTLRDPNASTYKKTMATATAAFSTVAATNIPVVSQIGAGLSALSSAAERITPKRPFSLARATNSLQRFFGRF